MKDAAELSMEEAVLLLHAQLAFLSDTNGIRHLFVKGPSVIDQGLRKARQSTDVDIWVDPDASEKLISDLTDLGWQPRPTDASSSPFPSHSLTLYNKQWPCDIDIHFRIPGMEAPVQTAFEAVWSRRQQHYLAGFPIHVPSTESSRLILALHSLRSLESYREPAEYDYLAAQNIEDLEEFQHLATQTDAVSALKPFLVDVGIATLFKTNRAPSDEWLYLSSPKSNADKRIDIILNSPLQQFPRAIWRAAFPTKEALMVHDLYQDTTRLGILRTNMSRYQRGLIALLTRLQKKFK